MALNIIHVPAAPDNYGGPGHKKVGAILHWMAGYLPGTDSMFRNPDTGYCTNFGVGSRNGRGDGYEVHRYTPDESYRAYGSYNDDADDRGLSIELENNWPVAASKPTPETHELTAQLLAELAVRHNWVINGKVQLVLGDFPSHPFYRKPIPGFGRDFNVTTHRSMALKDCPGTTDVAWIVARGNDIIQGKAGVTPGTDDNMLIYEATSASTDAVIPKGFRFIQNADGPLRVLSPAEWGAYDFWRTQGKQVLIAQWPGENIRALTRTVGLAQWSGISATDGPVLTGKLIFADPKLADYPKVSAQVTAPALTPAQLDAIATAVAAKVVIPTAPTQFTISGKATA